MYRVFILILCAALPLRANSDCANDSAQIKLALSPESLSIRNALFSQLCGSGELFDMTDPTLVGRLAEPRAIFPEHFMFDSKGVRGNLLLAYVVELDGLVRHITVLVSSGDTRLDEQAVRTWSTVRYKGPLKLDGRPVRLLMYFKFKAMADGR
jgi:TonB family protein